MPSPLRSNGGGGISYTRWEALDSEEQTSSSDQVPFHQFEEDRSHSLNNNNVRLKRTSVTISSPGRVKIDLPNSLWVYSIRGLYVLIVFGIGWVFGFLVRWGVHKYYIDPLGHCETPSGYMYSPETGKLAMDFVDSKSIQAFYKDFLTTENHFVGTPESLNFIRNISATWKVFGLQRVESEMTNVLIPESNKKMRPEIVVKDPQGAVVFKQSFQSEVAYSASAIAFGKLVYGHLGRFEDFMELGPDNFQNTTVMIRINPMFHTGSMVRNAQHFGAKAVILFPDPFYYKLTDNFKNDISATTAIDLAVEFYPGDPKSPYSMFSQNQTVPLIPVVSVDFKTAKNLLVEYTDLEQVSEHLLHGLKISTGIRRNFTASVEVDSGFKEAKLYNIIGTFPGRYEPTRYVIIGSHHDNWKGGNGKSGMGHAVMMELVRVFGTLFHHGWRPGRSILFASWDGEELGHLGSVSWMNSHAKELASRAVAVVNLDYELEGQKGPIAASPLFSQVIRLAAKSVTSGDSGSLHDIWLRDEKFFQLLKNDSDKDIFVPPSTSNFQHMFGISSLNVALKSLSTFKNHDKERGKRNESANVATAAKDILERQFKYSEIVTKFIVILVMQLVQKPDVPLVAADYGKQIHPDLHDFFRDNKDVITKHILDLGKAAGKFEMAASRFHNTYHNQSARLQFLAHHEFSDQTMELERSFLNTLTVSHLPSNLLRSPYRHLIYGPSALNPSSSQFLPRLKDALKLATLYEKLGYNGKDSKELWENVSREVFLIIDALDSATCVLDNHLVYTYEDEDHL